MYPNTMSTIYFTWNKSKGWRKDINTALIESLIYLFSPNCSFKIKVMLRFSQKMQFETTSFSDPRQIRWLWQVRRHFAVIMSVVWDPWAYLIFRRPKHDLWVNTGQLGTQPTRGSVRKLSSFDHISVPSRAAYSRDELGPEVVLHFSSIKSQLITVAFYRERGKGHTSSQYWI